MTPLPTAVHRGHTVTWPRQRAAPVLWPFPEVPRWLRPLRRFQITTALEPTAWPSWGFRVLRPLDRLFVVDVYCRCGSAWIVQLPVPDAFDLHKLPMPGLRFEPAFYFCFWDVLASNCAGVRNESLEIPDVIRLYLVGLLDAQSRTGRVRRWLPGES